jgi:hypothetical protein
MKTVAVDKYQRVRLPGVKGGQRFAVENKGNGILVLTEVKPVEPANLKPVKVRFSKHGRFATACTDRPNNLDPITEVLADFP